ncbi:caspase family protein [Nostoc sp. CHAB 5784]|uniref:nSTAND1 domain-containing NTPase n=1 Tax=Nostoc mirabile TaxID=2907820 RepID=UPI001E631805|nr:caspase family protein [Nostoc mirabile]MCC5665909.1 caspase family protein [Nostoc mirabile CHAB5784]
MARYALVIGIAEYLSPSLARLSKTTNDAEAIAQLLEQYGDFQSVQRLPQRWNKDKNGYEMAASKVTGAQLGQDLRTFLLEQAANNEALIYFSGHGFTISDNLGQQKGYLASSDCQIEFKDNENVEQKYGIPLDSLNDLIRDSQLSSLVMLLDCCHSGDFLERQLIERTLNAFSSQKDYYLITACRGFERAGVIKSEEYSIFTGAVVKGLAVENVGSSRRISGDRLFDFVSNELKGSVQEPIRMGWGRSITLVTYPQLDITTGEKIAFNQENPYRGLYAFESEQAQYFCGRDEAVRTLISRLAESRFLAVIGYSGSGKSSLVKAGLLPQLKGDRLPGSSQWAIASFTPGEHPLGKLVDILARQQQQNQPHLLFIDQFEEVFTLCQDDEERKAFIRLVAQEVKNTGGESRIILTIRGDFLNRCADYIEIITLINRIPPTSFIVTPMSFTELEEAIEKPAKLHGVTFEHGLVSQISADVVNRPGALPILQYALKELWRVCIEEPESPEPLLTRKGYEEIGGVKGALDKRATILYQSLTTIDQAFARRLFMELVQLGEAGEVTRRRASWDRLEAISDSSQQLQRVVGLLAGSQQRLIITDEKTIEVAHEALLSEWKLLNTWISENLENIRLSRSLEEDCQEWQQRFNKSDEALLAGANLAVISEWVNKTQPRLTPLETEFLHKSLERRDRQNRAELEQAKKLQQQAEAKAKAESQRTRFAIASAILIVLSLGLGLRLQQRIVEKKQGDAIASGALVGKSELLLATGNQLEAMIASVQALKELQRLGGENSKALNQLKVVIDSVKEHNRLEGHKDKVWGVSFSPDGKIASASFNQQIKIWDKNGKLLYDLPGHNKGVWSVRFSHNGKILASTSQDTTFKLWNIDAKEDKLIKNFQGHNNTVYDVSFSQDDEIIASGDRDGIIKVWHTDIQENPPQPLNTLNIKELLQKERYGVNLRHRVNSLDIDPNDSSKIAYVGDDGSVRIWDWKKNDTPPGKIGTHGQEDLHIVRYSLKRKNLLASAGAKGNIFIWNTKNPQKKPIAIIQNAHENIIYGLDFSPDGKMLASGGTDETVKVWDVDKAINGESSLIATLKAHTQQVNRLEFSRDGYIIASSSNDGTVRLWKWQSSSRTDVTPEVENLLKYSCKFLEEYLQTNKNISDYLNYQSGTCSFN